VPVAAVAEIVATSRILEVFMSALDDVPTKVCKAVNDCAVSVPAKVNDTLGTVTVLSAVGDAVKVEAKFVDPPLILIAMIIHL
jgi:hypothetical protein